MKKTLFTSDLHLGHVHVAELRGFESVAEHDQALINHWNAVVSPDDDVWVLGDFALGDFAVSMERARALKGRKTLIAGNHDRLSPAYHYKDDAARLRAEAKHIDAYRSVFSTLHNTGPVVVNGLPSQCIASHFPYDGDRTSRERYVEFRPPNDGAWLLHGHVHGAWRMRDHQINVGVDAWGMAPVSSDVICDIMNAHTLTADPTHAPLRSFMLRYGLCEAWTLAVALQKGGKIPQIAGELLAELHGSDDDPFENGLNSLRSPAPTDTDQMYQEFGRALEQINAKTGAG